MMSMIKTNAQARQNNPNNDTSQVIASIPIGSTVAVQWGDGGPWTHGI